MTRYLVLLVLLYAGGAGASDSRGSYLDYLRTTTQQLLCKNELFRSITEMNAGECIALLEKQSGYCDALIEGFIPEGDFDEVKHRLGDINVLYLSCVKGNALEAVLLEKKGIDGNGT